MPSNLYPDSPEMPQDQVKQLFSEVQTGMTGLAWKSLTEAYFPNSSNPEQMENGTAAFVDVNGTKLLVSNEHVICRSKLHHSFYGFNKFVNAQRKRYGYELPLDVGAVKVLEHTWQECGGQATAIPLESFALKHDPAPYEILWTAGYPGVRIAHLFEHSFATCQALPTQEYLFLDGEVPHQAFHPDEHFAVAYSPANAQRFDSTGPSSSPGLSEPPGLSGSLVWNTNRIKCFHEDRPWDPSMAKVTGIVWGWPGSGYLIATKVECFRSFLIEVASLPSSAD